MAKNVFLEGFEQFETRSSIESQTELKKKQGLERARLVMLDRQLSTAQIGATSQLISKLDDDVKSERLSTRVSASKELYKSLLTASKTDYTQERINAHKADFETYTSANKLASSRSYSDIKWQSEQKENLLEQKFKSVLSRVDVNRGEISDLPGFKKDVKLIDATERSIAREREALKILKQQRQDPVSILSDVMTTKQEVEGRVKGREFQEKLSQRKYGSAEEEFERLTAKLKDLNAAIEAVTNASSEEKEAKLQAAQQTQQELKDQEKTYQAAQKNPSDRGASNLWGLGGDGVRAIGESLRQVSGAFRSGAVSTPIQNLRNVTGFMEMQNEQYSTAKSAAAGDQMALLKMMGAYDAKKDYTETMFGRQRLASGVDTAGNLLIGGAGIAATLATGGAGGAALKTASTASKLAGASNIAGSASGMLADTYGTLTNTQAGQIGLEANAAYLNAFTVNNTIKANQMQAYDNQYRRSYASGIGFGIGSSAMKDLTDPTLLKEIASLNISPERMAELYSSGAATIGGKDFNVESIKSGGKAEAAGLLSAEQYQSLLGGMTNVGGKNQDLYNVLKSAVSIGMDDSKSISKMVSATVSMSDRSASLGVKYTGATTEAVLNAFQGTDNSLTTSQRVEVAKSTAAGWDKIMSEGGTDVFSLKEFSEIRKVMGNKPGFETAVAWEKAGIEDVQLLKQLNENEEGSQEYKNAASALIKKGLIAGEGSDISKGSWAADKRKREAMINVKHTIPMDRMFAVSSLTEGASQELRSWAAGDKDWSELKLSEDDIATAKLIMGNRGLTPESITAMTRGKTNLASGIDFSADPNRQTAKNKIAVEAEIKAEEAAKGKEFMAGIFGDEDTYHKATTQLMREGGRSAINKTQEERDKEAGQLMGPGSLIDAGKVFNAGADTFDKAVKDHFVKAVKSLEDTVLKINNTSRTAMFAPSEQQNHVKPAGVVHAGYDKAY